MRWIFLLTLLTAGAKYPTRMWCTPRKQTFRRVNTFLFPFLQTEMRINQGWKAHMQNPNPICTTLFDFYVEVIRVFITRHSSRREGGKWLHPAVIMWMWSHAKKKKHLAPLRCQTGQSNHMVWAQTFISQIEILLVSAEMSRCYPSPFLINSFVFLLDRYFFAQVTVDSTDGSRRSWLKSP